MAAFDSKSNARALLVLAGVAWFLYRQRGAAPEYDALPVNDFGGDVTALPEAPGEGDAAPPDDTPPASVPVLASIARGIRNNNPGNIRHGSPWQGMAAVQSDPAFIQFESMPYGVRAMVLLLRTYSRRYGLNTPAGIISRWAPPSENATGAYALAVARALGVSINTPLDVEDPATVAALVRAIARHENGAVASLLLTDAAIAQGVALAG